MDGVLEASLSKTPWESFNHALKRPTAEIILAALNVNYKNILTAACRSPDWVPIGLCWKPSARLLTFARFHVTSKLGPIGAVSKLFELLAASCLT